MPKKILLVDDDRVLLKFASGLLEKQGHEVVTAQEPLKGASGFARPFVILGGTEGFQARRNHGLGLHRQIADFVAGCRARQCGAKTGAFECRFRGDTESPDAPR